MRVVQRPLRRTRPRAAAAAAELAIILPVLTLVVLGCIDFGRFAYSYIALTNAVRAGAGFGSVNAYTTSTYGTWQSQVQQAVVDEMSGVPGFDSSQLTVTASGIAESGGLWRVQVTASYPFQPLTSVTGIPGNITMQRTVVLRAIR